MRAAPIILSRATRRAQRGMSMLFALMALVILGLGAVALTRSVDTGTLIMGNLGFKQDTLAASSSGAEQAIAWLQAIRTVPRRSPLRSSSCDFMRSTSPSCCRKKLTKSSPAAVRRTPRARRSNNGAPSSSSRSMIRRFTADEVTLSCSAALRIDPQRATSST